MNADRLQFRKKFVSVLKDTMTINVASHYIENAMLTLQTHLSIRDAVIDLTHTTICIRFLDMIPASIWISAKLMRLSSN